MERLFTPRIAVKFSSPIGEKRLKIEKWLAENGTLTKFSSPIGEKRLKIRK